jgi:flagellin-specific chaperone FliS
VVSFGALAMSKEAALTLLTTLQETLSNSKGFAEQAGLSHYYDRDVEFLQHAKLGLTIGDHEKIQLVFDQMRNLSQGFASYSPDEKEIDGMLDRLFIELQDALIR